VEVVAVPGLVALPVPAAGARRLAVGAAGGEGGVGADVGALVVGGLVGGGLVGGGLDRRDGVGGRGRRHPGDGRDGQRGGGGERLDAHDVLLFRCGRSAGPSGRFRLPRKKLRASKALNSHPKGAMPPTLPVLTAPTLGRVPRPLGVAPVSASGPLAVLVRERARRIDSGGLVQPGSVHPLCATTTVRRTPPARIA